MPPKTDSSRFDLDKALEGSARLRNASAKLRGRVEAPPPSGGGIDFKTKDSKSPAPTPPPSAQESEGVRRYQRKPSRGDAILNQK
jgi:hypothetical protein